VTVQADGIDTGNERRDGHLRSPDFFNAKQYPTITFESTSIEQVGENRYEVEGELTLIGQTRPVTATLEWISEGETPQGYKSGFEAQFSIMRSDFGMDKFIEGGGLGDEVTIMVTVEGARK